MEIRTFAERLLFADRLHDKLAPPGRLTDLEPGAPIAPPRFPSRPAELRPSRDRAPFPTVHELDRDDRRGHVLHFFANHELLATELMALVLLRFPDAPPALRRGLVHTIAEEQGHLRLYRERMAACGVELGAIPVNDFFWGCIASVSSPRDFLARMSLVFEQANLDHSLMWSRAFRTIGDHETASVLDLVYREEIGHVRFGLTWFDRLRDPGVPLWDAWASCLELPLTPSRAKGPELDRAGRRRAGLPDDFVDALAVHVVSRGRPPVVHLFNPDCEAEVARGRPGHTPGQLIAALARDLATLPALYCANEDVVLVDEAPSPAFLASLQRAGFALPEFARVDALVHPHLADLRPWGWSPDAEHRLRPLRARLLAERPGWRPSLRELSSKAWSAAQLAGLDACDPAIVGRSCATICEVRDAIEAIGLPVLLKLPFSTAGQGRRRLSTAPSEADLRWIRNALARQGALVVERWLDRVLDLSLQVTVASDGGCEIDGLVRFFTDQGGRFRGCVVGRATTGLPPALRRHLHGDGQEPDRAERQIAAVARALAPELAARGHVGPAGLDAMVYRQGQALALKPLVELNPRNTMGRVSLALRSRVAPGRVGLWLLVTDADARAAGHPDLASLARALEQRHPPVIQGGRVAGGALWTTDPARARAVAALLVVDKAIDACANALPAPLRPHAVQP